MGPLGAVAGRIGDRTVNCATGATGVFGCGADQQAPPYADDVRREVSALRSYFAGPHPLYIVGRDGDCFTLRLAPPLPEPAVRRPGALLLRSVDGRTHPA